ncbi:MAG TPA: hypothetical protein VH328_03655 [Burkholderiaceae bacterium]|nr:hypothetical protein [Burkholderiaceae bacterium]
MIAAGLCLACAQLHAAPETPPCPAQAAFAASRGGLRELLSAMASQRGFELHYWRADNPEVTLQAGDEVERINALAAQANVIVTFEPPASAPRTAGDARPHRNATASRRPAAPCPGKWQVREVWVLPVGNPQAAPAARSVATTRPLDAATLAWTHAHERHPSAPVAASAPEL